MSFPFLSPLNFLPARYLRDEEREREERERKRGRRNIEAVIYTPFRLGVHKA